MSEDKKQAYKNILKAVEKEQKHLTDSCYVNELKECLERRIKIQEVCEIFDIHTLREDSYNTNYIQIDNHERVIIYYQDNNGYKISWSDDNRQPENEYLYVISFPTGAYIFGDSYLKETFQEFFNELKSYNPKYIDSANKSLYFSPENAKKIHEDYKVILKKYQGKVSDEYNKIKVKKLREELAKLEIKVCDDTI